MILSGFVGSFACLIVICLYLFVCEIGRVGLRLVGTESISLFSLEFLGWKSFVCRILGCWGFAF